MNRPVKIVMAKNRDADAPAVHNAHRFSSGDFIVYPAHGVGQIVGVEEQEVAGSRLELFVINFVKDKMMLRVPTAKVARIGIRKLSDASTITQAERRLTQRPQAVKGIWSRIAQEYEDKIRSGDIVAIAEVVRDLYRSESSPEQSFSGRQLYETALDRLSREIAYAERIPEGEAIKKIEGLLAGLRV